MPDIRPFRRVGSAYRATDDHSTLWIRRDGRKFVLVHQLPQPQGGWSTLGTFDTLTAAVADGRALMAN